MNPEQKHNDVAVMAASAGLILPPERVPGLAAGLDAVLAARRALSRYDYGTLEPACRFVPPAPERR